MSGGIGRALAQRCLQKGYAVHGLARDEQALKQTAEALEGLQTHVCDATDFDALQSTVKAVEEAQGRIDGYVHAVGSVFLKPTHLMKLAEWHEVLNINLHSAFYGLKAVIEVMRKQRSGSMVFCSSVAACAGLANHEAIAAAKGGISGLVRAAAATYASNGVRLNAVAPGLVETNATAAMTGNEQMRTFSEKMHPLGRLGKADEVASLISWLLSDEASWVTGQIYPIDGGMGAIVPKPRV